MTGRSPSDLPAPAPDAAFSRLEELAEAFRRGDEAALRILLPTLRARISHVAKQGLEGPAAEEVVQETLATLWEKRESLGPADRFLPFVFQVLRNKIGNAYMRARRERRREAGEGEKRDLAANPGTCDPGLQAEAAELEAILPEAIRRCGMESPESGPVLEMLWEGRSPSEIEGALGDVPRSTILSRIHRARKRLREILRRDFHLEV